MDSRTVVILLYMVYQFSFGNAATILEYFTEPINFKQLHTKCRDEGGVTLMRTEQEFSNINTNDAIPYGEEFWIAEYLYTHWVTPVDCIQKAGQNQNPDKVTSEVYSCYDHCSNYPYFALRTNYCLCLDSHQISTNYQPAICQDQCSDIGLCGGMDSNKRQYLTVYEIHPDVGGESTQLQVPNNFGSGYIECLTARCPYNDYKGLNCRQTQGYNGLCGDGSLTASKNTYTQALLSCLQDFDDLFLTSCRNVSNVPVWIGPLRFTFSSLGGANHDLQVAKGAKCTKQFSGPVTCVPTTEATNLPFICKIYNSPTGTSTPTTSDAAQNNKDKTSTTGIIIGCVVGVCLLIGIIIIFVIIQKRRKNNFKMDKPTTAKSPTASPYEMPKSRSDIHDHVYADTTDVYHPYVELRDDGSTSYTNKEYASQNEVIKSNVQTNDIHLQVPKAATPRNSNSINGTALYIGSESYIEPATTPNFGRKLPDIPGRTK